jgi:hypothetical protein
MLFRRVSFGIAFCVLALLCGDVSNAEALFCTGDDGWTTRTTTYVKVGGSYGLQATNKIHHVSSHEPCVGNVRAKVQLVGLGASCQQTGSKCHSTSNGQVEQATFATCTLPACGNWYFAGGTHWFENDDPDDPEGYTVSESFRRICEDCPDSCGQSSPENCGAYEFCSITGPTDYCRYTYGCPSGESAEGTCCVQYGSPIVIDIAGNGFALTDKTNGVIFPLGPTDVLYRVSWTSINSDDAWLALDRNGNGVIDNGLELFGNHTSQPNPPPGELKNGFLALMVYDWPANGGNGDSVIDVHDSVFDSLLLWQGMNHDGFSQSAEIHTLGSLGVRSISLGYRESNRQDEWGNVFRYRANVESTREANVKKWAFDVFLQTMRVQ